MNVTSVTPKGGEVSHMSHAGCDTDKHFFDKDLGSTCHMSHTSSHSTEDQGLTDEVQREGVGL